MHIDHSKFDKKFTQVIDDIKKQEIKSPAWGWMAVGAVLGLAASCLRLKSNTSKPIMATYKKTGDR